MIDISTQRIVRVIGHKNPDTDSICSAIAYAYLKNQISSEPHEPRRAGEISKETAFVLNHFGVEPPRLSVDMSPNIGNIDIRQEPGVDGQMSCRAAWQRMNDRHIDTLCITNRAYLLFEGRILFQGSPEELAANPVVRKNYLTESFVLRQKDFSALEEQRKAEEEL